MLETVILALSKLSWLLSLPFVLAVACSGLSEFEQQQVNQALADSLLKSTESWEFTMNLMEDQALKMSMTGSYSFNIQTEAENITYISGPVHIQIFNEEKELESEVFCDSAEYQPDIEVFEMFENVEVTTQDGRILRSQHLLWERRLDRVSTPEFVIFISPPDSIAAKGFRGNSDLTDYTLNEGGGQVVID